MKLITTTLFALIALLALSLLATACASEAAIESTTAAASDTDAADSSATTAPGAETEPETEPEPEPASEEPESTDQWARVTLSTGEVFELTPTSCKNQTTDPNDLLNDEYVDLFARNDDGYRIGILNARVAGQDPAPTQVELSAKRDENGVNPKISYIAAPGVIEATTMTIDGARVTGESTIDARFSAEKPFGEEVVATFEFNC